MNKVDKLIDKFLFPKNLNYFLYWIIVGIFWFLASEFFVRIFNETYLFELRSAISILMILLGIMENFIRINFNKSITFLNEIIVFPTKKIQQWQNDIDITLFTTKTPIAKIIVIAISVFTISVMAVYGLPFKSDIANIIFVLSLLPGLCLCAMGAYMLIYLLYILYKVNSYPIKIPFYILKHISIINLSSFFNQASLLVLVCYVWLIFTIYLSPYELEGIILSSAVIIGFYPLAMFLWSFFQIHKLLQNIKQKHIQTINTQIQIALFDLQKKPSKEKADLLTKLMEIQKSIESLNDFPLAINEILTFIITLGIPIINFIISFTDLFQIK